MRIHVYHVRHINCDFSITAARIVGPMHFKTLLYEQEREILSIYCGGDESYEKFIYFRITRTCL
jgi:hypothetical protein